MNSLKPLNEYKARAELIEVARSAYDRGYICGTEGNFSIRLDSRRILTTPSGACKARLSPSDFLVTNLEGELEPESLKQSKKPSTELRMHLPVYELRADVRAIVHAHPTTAVAFTVAGETLDLPILPEGILALGAVPVAPYATPSTEEVPESIREAARTSNCLMLDHHGALTMGASIHEAYYLLETLEHYAKTLLTAKQLGGARPLTKEQVEKLFAICHVYGIKPPNSAQTILNAAK